MRLSYFLIANFFVLVLCAQKSDYQTLLLDKALTENANAIFRVDEMRIHIEARDKMNFTVKQAVTVLNKHGDKYANPTVFYDKERKVKHLEAFVYDALGKEIKHIKKKDFRDISAADGFSLYLDNRLLTYSYTPIQYPYTMEFVYEIETGDTGMLPPWNFIPGYLIGVEKSLYEITYARSDLKPVVKECNLIGFPIGKEEGTGSIRYTAKNLPGIKAEAHSPNPDQFFPQLMVRLQKFHYKGYDGDATDWNLLGKWVDASLLEGRMELPETTKTLARSLVKGVEDDLEKARIIYKYVQDNTRYVSVQIGIGGLMPISALEVDRVKYGDCKGLSNYTRALLDAVGVKAYYTVVEAGSRKVDFKEDFADLRQGNHIILAIPYKDALYWIDCTSQVHPFGFVGDFTDGRRVLMITPDGGKLGTTVAYENERNHQLTQAEYDLLEDGSIQGAITIATQGIQYDDHFGLEKKSGEDVVKYYKDYLKNVNNLQVGKYAFNNDRDSIVFTEKLAVSARNYASFSGDRILFSPNAFNKNSYVPKRYRNRKLPFEIHRGYLDEDHFSIRLPEGYGVEALPEAMEMDTPYGAYHMQVNYNEEDHTLDYKRSLFLKKGLHPKEVYSDYRGFRKKIASADNAQVVLLKSNL
ncbi:MAG: DUF3857 domain-containing protein [Bacteroidota bacterium]